MTSIDWLPGEVLVLGSSTAGPLTRVFLGSRATKLIRHSPVPVLVVPRGYEIESSYDRPRQSMLMAAAMSTSLPSGSATVQHAGALPS